MIDTGMLRQIAHSISAALLLAMVTGLYAEAPDRIFSENKLHENRYFLEFINPGISNFNNEDHISSYKKAVKYHYQAHKAFLASEYSMTVALVRKSQSVLKELYYLVLKDVYRKQAQELLHYAVASIVYNHDRQATHLIKLGYRDVKTAAIIERKGHYYNKFLYSIKIHFFIDGIKVARQSKRFALLALMVHHTPMEDRDDYKKQSVNDAFNPEINKKEQSYLRVKKRLQNMLNRNLIEDELNFFVHHDDNYGFIHPSKKSILDSIDLSEFEKPDPVN